MPSVEFNYIAVFAVAVLNMMLGFVWYAPFLFGNIWAKGQGTTLKEMEKKGNPMLSIGFSMIGSVVISFAVAYLVGAFNLTDVVDGIVLGLFVAFGLVFTTGTPDYFFAGRSKVVMVISVGYQMTAVFLMALIHTLWN